MKERPFTHMVTGRLPKGLASSNAPKIAKRLGSVSGGRVLDVATDQGGFIDTLMKTLKDYDSFVGIDSCASENSREELKDARIHFRGKPVRFLEMNGEDLKFKDRSFDTVCISYALHHLDRVDAVLAEMKRVLKAGGYFILQEAYCDGDQTEAQKVDELEHEWDARIDSLLGITHNKTFTRQRIMDIANGLGLRELEVYDSSRPVDCLFCERRQACDDPKESGEVPRFDQGCRRDTQKDSGPSRPGSPEPDQGGGREDQAGDSKVRFGSSVISVHHWQDIVFLSIFQRSGRRKSGSSSSD